MHQSQDSVFSIYMKLPPKRPKFKDVSVFCSNTHFCFRILEMHSKRLIFQNFSRNSLLCRELFFVFLQSLSYRGSNSSFYHVHVPYFFACKVQHFFNESLLDSPKSVVFSWCVFKPSIFTQ